MLRLTSLGVAMAAVSLASAPAGPSAAVSNPVIDLADGHYTAILDDTVHERVILVGNSWTPWQVRRYDGSLERTVVVSTPVDHPVLSGDSDAVWGISAGSLVRVDAETFEVRDFPMGPDPDAPCGRATWLAPDDEVVYVVKASCASELYGVLDPSSGAVTWGSAQPGVASYNHLAAVPDKTGRLLGWGAGGRASLLTPVLSGGVLRMDEERRSDDGVLGWGAAEPGFLAGGEILIDDKILRSSDLHIVHDFDLLSSTFDNVAVGPDGLAALHHGATLEVVSTASRSGVRSYKVFDLRDIAFVDDRLWMLASDGFGQASLTLATVRPASEVTIEPKRVDDVVFGDTVVLKLTLSSSSADRTVRLKHVSKETGEVTRLRVEVPEAEVVKVRVPARGSGSWRATYRGDDSVDSDVDETPVIVVHSDLKLRPINGVTTATGTAFNPKEPVRLRLRIAPVPASCVKVRVALNGGPYDRFRDRCVTVNSRGRGLVEFTVSKRERRQGYADNPFDVTASIAGFEVGSDTVTRRTFGWLKY